MTRQWIVLVLILISTPRLMGQSTEHTAQPHSMHEHDGHSAMAGMADMSDSPPENPAKLLADKKESEFNHHTAGLFPVIAASFILAQALITPRYPSAKYVWPAMFLVSGGFLLVWSDTELWPFGHRQWLEALLNNREVLQHKTFAVLLLGLGSVEWLRANGTLRNTFSTLCFPVLAVAGSILLLFHQHEGGMHGANHMEVMARIQSEHLQYAMMGLGLGLTKAFSEFQTRGQKLFGTLWPLLMVGLGVLLMFYQE